MDPPKLTPKFTGKKSRYRKKKKKKCTNHIWIKTVTGNLLTMAYICIPHASKTLNSTEYNAQVNVTLEMLDQISAYNSIFIPSTIEIPTNYVKKDDKFRS